MMMMSGGRWSLSLLWILVFFILHSSRSQDQPQKPLPKKGVDQQQECDAVDGVCRGHDDDDEYDDDGYYNDDDDDDDYYVSDAEDDRVVTKPIKEKEEKPLLGGDPQNLPTDMHRMRYQEGQEYVRRVLRDPFLSVVWELCQTTGLQHPDCTDWALHGECEKNPSYMQSKCAAVCFSCHALHTDTKCPLTNYSDNDPDINLWKPGDLDAFFQNLTQPTPQDRYEPIVLSRPLKTNNNNNNNNYNASSEVRDGPWIVVLENFLSDEEADRLVELGYKLGYKRSQGVGGTNPDGTISDQITDARTSTNAFCNDDVCSNDPLEQQVRRRIAGLFRNHPDADGFSEHLQILKYEVGEYYEYHHDYVLLHRKRQAGVRILTVFLYLNDVEEGGATRFTHHPVRNLTVLPRKGRALVWPHVLNHAPHLRDGRTYHEAMPVLRGRKFAANAWVHQRNFLEPFQRGC